MIRRQVVLRPHLPHIQPPNVADALGGDLVPHGILAVQPVRRLNLHVMSDGLGARAQVPDKAYLAIHHLQGKKVKVTTNTAI